MKHKEDTWGWMLAVDFFFAGMGGAMLLIAGIADLFLGQGSVSLLGSLLAGRLSSQMLALLFAALTLGAALYTYLKAQRRDSAPSGTRSPRSSPHAPTAMPAAK